MHSTRFLKNKFCIYGIIVTLILCSCAKRSSDSYNDLNKSKLHGSVKSLIETDYSNSGKYTTHIVFNSGGYISKQESFNPDVSLIRRWVYEYDQKNHPCQGIIVSVIKML